jgi:hypothetical protein
MAEIIPFAGSNAHSAAQTHPEYRPFPQDSELFFNVSEKPAAFPTDEGMHQIAPDKKFLVRDIDGVDFPLAVVGKGYNVVSNRELFSTIEDTMLRSLSHRELQDVQTLDKMSYHGSVCLREYRFPRIEAKAGESKVCFRSVVVNGYGASSVKVMTGAIDFFCTNGMITGEFDMFVRKHTAGMYLGDVVTHIKESIQRHYKNADVWDDWSKKFITAKQVEDFLSQVSSISKRKSDQIFNRYAIETERHGPTVWALYNAMTYFSSHPDVFPIRDTGKDNRAATVLKREQTVLEWTNSREFQQLAA